MVPKQALSVTRVWSDRINGQWRNSAAQIIAVGRTLLECKEAVAVGDFQRMVKTELDFGPSMARKIMAIVNDPRLTSVPVGTHSMPNHWTTLYELHRLDDEALAVALSSERPLQRHEVKQLRAPTNSPAREGGPPSVGVGRDGVSVPSASSFPGVEAAAMEAATSVAEPAQSGHTAGSLSVANQCVRAGLTWMHQVVVTNTDPEAAARDYAGDLNPGQIAAIGEWLDEFYSAFVKIESGIAA